MTPNLETDTDQSRFETTDGMASRALNGGLDAVVRQLGEVGVHFKGPVAASTIAGGRSNITIRLADEAGSAVALRRPPFGPILPSAHDVLREARIIAALGETSVPVPAVRLACDDTEIIGTPFYVADWISGPVLRSATDADAVPMSARPAATTALIDTLAAIHAVDLDAAGLDALARRSGYLERQLDRWCRQWDLATTREVDDVLACHRLLVDKMPESDYSLLVHGDYRFDNVILDGDHAVGAVLDWELSTLGDPYTDLGILLAYWTDSEDEVGPLDAPPSCVPGFGNRNDVVNGYELAIGRSVPHVWWYFSFACWKLAIIMEGVVARQSALPEDERLDVIDLTRRVDALVQRAIHTARTRAI